MANGYGGYSPYTGAGNLASAMGANPNFGGSTGGYQSGGYQYPNNVGGVNYSGAAPSGYAWGANGLVPIGTGQAGIQAYNPAISTSPTRSFQAPQFTNSMSNWLGGGNGQNISAMTPSSSGGFMVPGGGSSGGGGSTSSFGQGSPSASPRDPFASLYAAMGLGPSAGSMGTTMSGGSPYGTAAGNAAAWPNPGVSLSGMAPGQPGFNQNMQAGIGGAEGASLGGNNPYQVTSTMLTDINRRGAGIPVGPDGLPANANASAAAMEFRINELSQQYNTPGQVATGYNYPANVASNASVAAGGTPYLRNQPIRGTVNQTPQNYLMGNPQSGYPGAYAGLVNSAASNQFMQAAMTPGMTLNSVPQQVSQGGRYH